MSIASFLFVLLDSFMFYMFYLTLLLSIQVPNQLGWCATV